MKVKPLIMWAGGKTKMLKHYQRIIPTTGFDTYIEPFFGGGAVFLWMKQQNPTARFIINDVNKELMNLFRVIRDDVDQFIIDVDFLEQALLNLGGKEERKKFFYQIRQQYWDLNETKLLSTFGAAKLYFLMKTAFNGIWQTCTESHGRFGTPAGLLNQTKSIYDKDLVKEWNRILKGVEIHCGDFFSLDIPDESAIIYCDPPYVNSFADYGTGFSDKDQEKLVKWAEIHKDLGHRVFISNRDTDDKFIKNLVPNSKVYEFPITYTAGRRKKTEEGNEAVKATELLIDV